MKVFEVVKMYFKHHKIRLLLVLLSIVLVALLSLAPAQVLRIIIDENITNHQSETILLNACLLALAYFLIGLVTFIKDIIVLSTSLKLSFYLKESMMKHVHKLSYQVLVKTDSASLEAYFNNDVNSINELFSSGVINLATDLFKMLGILVSLFLYSISFGLIILAVLPILILFTFFVRKQMLKAQLKKKSLEGNVNQILLENVENIEQVKVNKAEKYVIGKYDQTLKNHFRANQTSNLYDAIFSPVMQMLRSSVICVILLACGIDNNIFNMSIGMVISGITLITDLFTPIESLGMEIQTIQKSVAAIKRINEFFQLETDDIKEKATISGNQLVYEHVDFSYDDRPVIKDFSLTISKGEKIAFQGPSGVGKSTLMKLAMGLIKPQNGTVCIDGFPNYLIDDDQRRKLFSIVYQDSFFSNGSIYEEISLGDQNITKEMVQESLNEVGLNYITDLDEQLDAKRYSSGELALFNIARVICRNSPIIFLDEMNAKIDPITGKKIVNIINQIADEKIVISINHYGSILAGAKIVRLSK